MGEEMTVLGSGLVARVPKGAMAAWAQGYGGTRVRRRRELRWRGKATVACAAAAARSGGGGKEQRGWSAKVQRGQKAR
jgi:hypothetical protein